MVGEMASSIAKKLLPVGVASAIAAGILSQPEEAEAYGTPIKAGSEAAQKILSNAERSSSTWRLAGFKFPSRAPKVRSRQILDVLRLSEDDPVRYAVLDNGTILPMSKDEAHYLSAELGSRIYRDVFRGKDPIGKEAQARLALERKLAMKEPTRITPEIEEIMRGMGINELVPQATLVVPKIGKNGESVAIQLIRDYAEFLESIGIGKIEGGMDEILKEFQKQGTRKTLKISDIKNPKQEGKKRQAEIVDRLYKKYQDIVQAEGYPESEREIKKGMRRVARTPVIPDLTKEQREKGVRKGEIPGFVVERTPTVQDLVESIRPDVLQRLLGSV